MFQHLYQLFFPNLCAGCQSLLMEQEDVLCLPCYSSLDFIIQSEQSLSTAKDRFFGKLSVQQLQSLFYYHKEEGIVNQMIDLLKYKKQEDLGRFLAELTIERLGTHPIFQADEIVAVPLHPKKEKLRGYNQLHLFCETLSKHYQIPFDKNRIKKNIHDRSQTKKNLSLRSNMKKERFFVQYNEHDSGKHFLLIDDIITTGSTIEQVGKKLLEIPQSKLSVFSIAVTQ